MTAEQQIRQLWEANYNIWWPDDDGIVCNVHKISVKSVTFSAVVYDDQLPVICNHVITTSTSTITNKFTIIVKWPTANSKFLTNN